MEYDEEQYEYFFKLSTSYISKTESFTCFKLFNEEINLNLAENNFTHLDVLLSLYETGSQDVKIAVISNLMFYTSLLEKIVKVEPDSEIVEIIEEEILKRTSDKTIKAQVMVFKKALNK